MVSKTNGVASAVLIPIMLAALSGCPAWHSDTPPRVPVPAEPVACGSEATASLEGQGCAPNGETCEVDCRDERAQCVVLICEQHLWRKMNIPPPPPP